MVEKLKDYRNHWRDVLVVSTAILVLGSFLLVAYGINQNNKIVSRVNDHVDCILKASATPPPPGTSSTSRKYIVNALSNECQVKFTP